MKKFKTPRLFIVIHTLTGDKGLNHVITETAIAKANGADGIFIIPDYAKGRDKMATTSDQFLYLQNLKERFSDFLIGANFLKKTIDLVPDIYTNSPNLLQIDGDSLYGIEKEKLPTTESFCGVAFKYSKKVHFTGNNLKIHCSEIESICHVPTTSGDATGSPASLEKVKEIRSYLLEDTRLGIASGVTIQNLPDYLEAGVTDFLVATSLIDHVDQDGFDILNPKSVEEMSKIIKNFA